MNTAVLHRFPPDLRTYSAKITRISAATSPIFAYQACIFYHTPAENAIVLSNFFISIFVEKREILQHAFVQIQQITLVIPFQTAILPHKETLQMPF